MLSNPIYVNKTYTVFYLRSLISDNTHTHTHTNTHRLMNIPISKPIHAALTQMHDEKKDQRAGEDEEEEENDKEDKE